MTVTEAVDRARVDRIDLVTGRYQRTDQQATVGLDPDQDLRWVLSMVGQHGVQPVQLLHALWDPPAGQQPPSSSSTATS
jgi:hypothetical protein